PDEGIDVIGGPDLDGGCAGDHELQRVSSVDDAADADDRNLHHLPALVDHADRNRPYGGSAEAADDIRDLRPPALDVNHHCQKGGDQRPRVGAAVFRSTRERTYNRHILSTHL